MDKKYFLFMAVIALMLFSVFEANAREVPETPKEKEAIVYLKIGSAVFVCFHDAKDPDIARIKAEIGRVSANFKGAVEAVYISGDDKKEDSFRDNLSMLPNETAVFIIIPSGQIVAKLAGADITKENLMKGLLAPRTGGCCPAGAAKACN